MICNTVNEAILIHHFLLPSRAVKNSLGFVTKVLILDRNLGHEKGILSMLYCTQLNPANALIRQVTHSNPAKRFATKNCSRNLLCNYYRNIYH